MTQPGTLKIAFLICHAAPPGPDPKDTISRWIKQTMKAINTEVFSPHSAWGAATSVHKAAYVPIQEIMNTARWCSDSTFPKLNDRPTKSENNFAEGVLNSISS